MLSRRRFFFRAAHSTLAAEVGLHLRAVAQWLPAVRPNNAPSAASVARAITINVNGLERTLTVEPRVTLPTRCAIASGLRARRRAAIREPAARAP
jgi:DNA-binding transcriptional regulator YdaS (Cro superfamily)